MQVLRHEQLSSAQLDELLNFATQNPGDNVFDIKEMRWFLSRLISSSHLIFDLFDQKGRLGLAVLLDQVRNPGNLAVVEILGLRVDVCYEEFFKKLVSWAYANVSVSRSGFQMSFTTPLKIPTDILSENGLFPYYDTYYMQCESFSNVTKREFSEITGVILADCDELYDLICHCFAKNLDINIPDEHVWKEKFLKSSNVHTFVWRSHEKILGFATLAIDPQNDIGEISTLGVLPEVRGKGIGLNLLSHCLYFAHDRGVDKCNLTVATSNQSALGLYQRTGFRVTEILLSFRTQQ